MHPAWPCACAGRALAGTQESVEDTKGNNGDLGELRATNLRIMWISKKSRRTNISIGLNCITSINTKAAKSRLKGVWCWHARARTSMRTNAPTLLPLLSVRRMRGQRIASGAIASVDAHLQVAGRMLVCAARSDGMMPPGLCQRGAGRAVPVQWVGLQLQHGSRLHLVWAWVAAHHTPTS